ncbi:MAG: type II toxin-antitoxin system Phd/YefM family antitoxin [Candidatus Aminicenantes bacterium]|nr:type II toxin-antitoxin system Phd/YefM family antitoxin [Candidatus Aminicenantes bacterium]
MKLSLKEDINSLSYFKSHFNDVLSQTKNKKRPLIITQNGKAAGVFLDIDTWEVLIKKINLLRLLYEGEVSLREKEPKSLEEVETYFNKKYGF